MTHKEAIALMDRRFEIALVAFDLAFITREEYEALRNRIKELETLTLSKKYPTGLKRICNQF